MNSDDSKKQSRSKQRMSKEEVQRFIDEQIARIMEKEEAEKHRPKPSVTDNDTPPPRKPNLLQRIRQRLKKKKR